MEGRPLEDAELVGLARRGDTHAYEELVRRHQDAAARVAYLILRTGQEVEDVVQEAFIKAYRALGRFREDAPFRPWLFRIVANEARNRRRSAGRHARLALRLAQDRPSGDAAPSPESAVLRDEDRATVLEAVSRMRDEDRLVIGYRYFLDMNERDMAEALGCAPGTVKSRLSRALGRLRQELGTLHRTGEMSGDG